MPTQRTRCRVYRSAECNIHCATFTVADMPPKTRRSVSDDEDDALASRLVALLNDDQVLAKLKSVLYPRELYAKIDSFTDRVTSLTIDLAAKEAKIEALTTRVESLEAEADRQERYSRRPNLRFQGVPESAEGSTDQKIVRLVNDTGWSTSAWNKAVRQ